MRLGFLLLLLIAVMFGTGFWYQLFDPQCKVPVTYRIGQVDERFGTDQEELKRIAKNAERMWEEGLNKELFIYAEDGNLPINLVFDERQKNADLEEELRRDLETREGMSEHVASQYERLIAEFRTLKKEYESKVVMYESKLSRYNTTVTDWNENGGAPPDEIEILQQEQKELQQEQFELEAQAKKLNNITGQLNRIGAQGNDLITDYNKIVEEYNDRFSEIHEYTQGDHSMEEINIYQFNTEEELTLVLAHEFGHALWLGHVENEKSIMHRLMGGQTIEFGLSREDINEFEQVCEQKGFLEKTISIVRDIL